MTPKVGDRVRFLNELGLYKELKGTVEGVDLESRYDVFIRPDGWTYSVWASTLDKSVDYLVELLPRPDSIKPKVGDRVRCTSGEHEGKIGTIVKLDPGTPLDVYVRIDGEPWGYWMSTNSKGKYHVEILPKIESTKPKVRLGVSDDQATYEPTYAAISPKDKEEIAELVISKLAKLLGGNSNDDY